MSCRDQESVDLYPQFPLCHHVVQKNRLLLFYLTTLPTSYFVLCRMVIWLLHWERCLRKWLCYSLRYCPDLKLKMLKKTSRGQSSGHDFNLGYPELGAGLPPTRQ